MASECCDVTFGYLRCLVQPHQKNCCQKATISYHFLLFVVVVVVFFKPVAHLSFIAVKKVL